MNFAKNVKPIRFSEQVQYTRSVTFVKGVGKLLFFNFNLHEAHHAYPSLPAYHLNEVELQTPNTVGFLNLGPELDKCHSFLDTAAVIMSLDLVISSDTATAHLAGALGRPVWLLLNSAPDWRWQLNRQDSPWYPTMRLFRQENPRDWSNVINLVQTALKDFRQN